MSWNLKRENKIRVGHIFSFSSVAERRVSVNFSHSFDKISISVQISNIFIKCIVSVPCESPFINAKQSPSDYFFHCHIATACLLLLSSAFLGVGTRINSFGCGNPNYKLPKLILFPYIPVPLRFRPVQNLVSSFRSDSG